MQFIYNELISMKKQNKKKPQEYFISMGRKMSFLSEFLVIYTWNIIVFIFVVMANFNIHTRTPPHTYTKNAELKKRFFS